MLLSLGKKKIIISSPENVNEHSLKEKKRRSRNLCIDKCAKLQSNLFFISGWHFHECGVQKISVKFSKGTMENVPFALGERQDVSTHHRWTGTNHDWGFTIILKSELKGKPTALRVFLKDGTDFCFSLPPIRNENILDCITAIANYNVLQKKDVIELLNACGIKLGARSMIGHDAADNTEGTSHSFIEKAVRLKNGLMIYGWVNDQSDNISSVSLYRNGILLSANLPFSRRVRLDVNEAFFLGRDFQAGLIVYVPLSDYRPNDSFNLELQLSSTQTVSIHFDVDDKAYSDFELTEHILANVDFRRDNVHWCLENTLLPAICDVWGSGAGQLSEEMYEFCLHKKAASFSTSIIVPIYGRFDFINYQLAHFADDKAFNDVELIYAVDDPRIIQDVIGLCRQIANVHDVYFKVLFFNANLGFGGINNQAARCAKGKNLLLLNSDILPKSTNWLQTLIHAYETLENPGVLGADLLFHDESIQHIGMAQEWSPQFNIWLNTHPGKGLPKSIFQVHGIEEVATVTGACMVISRDLFERVGGFTSSYALGDFEDSDLCFKVLQLGFTNYVCHDVEMYHLERQSQNLVDNGDWKFKLTLLNGWQHSIKWGSEIQARNSYGK